MLIGKTISHYRITRQIAAGGMGVVYEAVDTKLDRLVALKFLASHLTRDQDAKVRFVREAKAAATLSHPNIATVYEIDEAEEGTFIAMELVPGTSLREVMNSGSLPLARATAITSQIAKGLMAAHEHGILHRDIKPANILINDDGEVKIVDFGLAKLVGSTNMTAAGTTLGTVAYMSPEQAFGGKVARQTDIWSLGVIHYEMLTGQLPFRGKNSPALIHAIIHDEFVPASELVPDLPVSQDEVIGKALVKDPARRFASGREFLVALEDPESPFAETTELPSVAKRWINRPRVQFDLPRSLVVGAALIVVAMVAGGYFALSNRTISDFRARDYLLITDFEDLTGTGGLQNTLRTALSIDIQQSRYVNVYSGKRLTDALARMEKPPGEPITPELGIELGIRETIPMVLSGSVTRLADQLMIAVQLIRPDSGEIIFATRVTAADEAAMLPALDDLSLAIRERLGEPISSIRDSDEPLAQVTTSSLEALRQFSDGNQAFLEADWDRAIPFLSQAVAEDSTFAMAYAKLARIHFYTAGTADALRYSDMAYRWRDRLTRRERLYIEGEYFRYRQQYGSAIASMSALLEEHPDDLETHNNLTTTYLMTLQYDKALQLLLQADESKQSTVYNVHTLGTTYAGLADFQKAIPLFIEARAANPAQMRAQLAIATCYLCDGDHPAAAAAMDTLATMAGTRSVGPEFMLAKCLPALGRYEDTLAHLKHAGDEAALQGQDSQVAYTHLYAGMCEYRRGNHDRSIEAFGSAVELWPGSRPLYCLGQAHARNGDLEAAARVAAELGELARQEPTRNNRNALIKVEAEIAYQRGDHGRAIELLGELLPTAMGDLDARYDLGRARLAAGDPAGARRSFEFIVANRYFTIVAGVPSLWPLAEYQLGLVAEADGRPADARRHFENFLRIWSGADDGLAEVADASRRIGATGGG